MPSPEVRVRAEAQGAPVAAEPVAERHRAVAVTSVDPGLRGPQRGDRLEPPLVQAGWPGSHRRGEKAPRRWVGATPTEAMPATGRTPRGRSASGGRRRLRRSASLRRRRRGAPEVGRRPLAGQFLLRAVRSVCVGKHARPGLELLVADATKRKRGYVHRTCVHHAAEPSPSPTAPAPQGSPATPTPGGARNAVVGQVGHRARAGCAGRGVRSLWRRGNHGAVTVVHWRDRGKAGR